jgi:hypothetical protein
VVGQGGATQGVAPVYSDRNKGLWVPPAAVATAPKTVPAKIDSTIAASVKAHNDTVAAYANQRQPGDWTFGKNKDWGIDPKWIKLGPVQLPTAILGLLPLNVTGNPIQQQREAQLSAMHQDILYHARTAMNEDEFRQAVKEERQRKEREHQLQLHQKPADDNKEPTLANSGQRDPVIPQP